MVQFPNSSLRTNDPMLIKVKVSWGISLACHAAVHNKKGLYAARFFLGLVQSLQIDHLVWTDGGYR